MMGDRLGIDLSNSTLYDPTFEDFIRSFDLSTCFFSFFLNVLVARTLILTRSREAPITTIFIAIVFADAVNSVMGFVLCISYFFNAAEKRNTVFEKYLCNFYGVITWGNCGATILLTATLSILRLIGIKWPFIFKHELSQSRLLLMVAFCYIFGYVEGLKPYIMGFSYNHQNDYYQCSIFYTDNGHDYELYRKTALIASLAIPLFVPVAVLVLTSATSILTLYQPMIKDIILKRQPSDLTRRTAARVTMAMVTCFLCCYTPWMLAHCLWFVIFTKNERTRSTVNNIMNIGQVLEMTGVYINAFLNPLIIIFSNKAARRRMTRRLKRDVICSSICPSLSCGLSVADLSDEIPQENIPSTDRMANRRQSGYQSVAQIDTPSEGWERSSTARRSIHTF